MAEQWQGKTRGGILGHRIFVFIISRAGLRPAYFILRFVAFYYLLFSRSTPIIYRYFRKVHQYGKWKSFLKTYKNYRLFGQTMLDKVALLSGATKSFTVTHEGGEVLDEVSRIGKGGILISAHIGNWEVAGQLLNRLGTGFNILMYENEHKNLSRYMEGVLQQKKFKVIAIRDGEMSHLVELHNAFSENELVVMHADRFREGNQTLETEFFGRKAKFPAGPFILGAKFGVPIVIVFGMKESASSYRFFALPPLQVTRTRNKAEEEKNIQELLNTYVKALEQMVMKYPEQWFNYYEFWE
jgi:predicted LPLAT superfamily acyltransferase